MRISVVISLGNFENLKVVSSEFKTAKECVQEMIEQVLSKIKSQEVQEFIEAYLLDVYYDESKSIKNYRKNYKWIREMRQNIGRDSINSIDIEFDGKEEEEE